MYTLSESDIFLVSGGVMVPKGTSTLIAPWAIHMNKDTYPDPEKFDPDRFLPENSVSRHPFAYIPFSAGSRNCIGMFSLIRKDIDHLSDKIFARV